MKDIILPLFLILLLIIIEVDGSRSILKRKQAIDRCHRMQEVRRCSGAPSSWHFDLRVSECRQSNEEECGSRGNRFQTKEDCEKICVGSQNISARHFEPGYHHPQRQQPHVSGLRWPDPCCRNNHHCNGHYCGHNRPIPPPLIIPPVSYPCPGHHCPPCNIHPCPKPQPCTGHHCPYECDHSCPSPPPTLPPQPPPPPPTTPCPVHHCRHECNPCPYHYPRPSHPIQSPCHHESTSRCCSGCRTGTYRRPCHTHHRCGYDCRNVTSHNCSSTTVAPSPATRVPAIEDSATGLAAIASPPTTREQPIMFKPRGTPGSVACRIADPNVTCDMHCENGYKKNSNGCWVCECEERR